MTRRNRYGIEPVINASGCCERQTFLAPDRDLVGGKIRARFRAEQNLDRHAVENLGAEIERAYEEATAGAARPWVSGTGI
ncbi:MAG: hypothetical protein QOJ15_180 [Bradyrhizobium sp.]|jgi:hypothetical protein|nr:hypothetical protein [Bradyrhizobium sp.]